MSEEKLSKKEYEEYIFLKQLRNNELAKIVRNKMYKQKLTADNMIVLQEKQLNKQKEVLDKIKKHIEENKLPEIYYDLESLKPILKHYIDADKILELLEEIE